MAACLLLPIALFIAKTLDDRATILAQAERDVESTTSIFEQHAHNNFETAQLVAQVADERVRGLSWREIETSGGVHDYLAGLVRDYPQIHGVFVIDRDGNARASSFPPDLRLPNYADRPYFTALKAGHEGTWIGPRLRSRLHPTSEVIAIARRRTVPDGGFDGIVVVSALPSSFEQIWQAAAPAGITAVFDGDGMLLARSPKPPGGILQTRVSEELLNATRAHDRGILHLVSAVEGVPIILAYHKLAGYPIFSAHALRTAEILQPWRRTLLRDSGLFATADVGLVLLALLVNRRARREEIALAIRTDELAVEIHQRLVAEAELEDVLRDTVERQEAHRSRIARDLHDGLGQHVVTLHFGLDDIYRNADNAGAVREKAQGLQSVATAVSHEIGRIAWELRPVALDDLGLQTAIQTLVETIATHSGLTFDLHITLGDRRLDSAKETALYRVVQEGLANTIKHADATCVGISLEATENEVRLIIEDDGKGFAWDESAVPRKYGGGSGLLSMRERLALVGGTLEIETAVGQGTALLIRVPVGG